MKTPRKWSDQPVVVEEGEILCEFSIGTTTIEVRRIDYEVGYYVTVGNFFGSQTVKTPDANTTFRLIGDISAGRAVGEVPTGCELVK